MPKTIHELRSILADFGRIEMAEDDPRLPGFEDMFRRAAALLDALEAEMQPTEAKPKRAIGAPLPWRLRLVAVAGTPDYPGGVLIGGERER